MTDEELKALVASLAIAQKETSQQMAQNDARFEARFEKLEAQMARTEAQMARTDARLDRLAKLVGNISNNQGDIAEEFFYRSFKRNPVINGVRFDWVEKQLHNRVGDIEDEYDIVLLNGNSLAVIEVKLKAHVNDLEKLLFKKMVNFPVLFTMYKDYKKYAGLATLVTNEELIEKAKELGLFLFTQHGKHTELVNTGRLLS